MLYLELFWTFFKIGAVSFGGGYAMIPVIKQAILENGWLSEDMILYMIGVSESTPGPIAINLATFVGGDIGGFLGAVCSTLGVVLPSFIIILLIAMLVKNLLQNKFVKDALSGIRPVVLGLILATGLLLTVKTAFPALSAANFDIRSLAIMLLLWAISLLAKPLFKKNISAVTLIIISAVLGILVWGII